MQSGNDSNISPGPILVTNELSTCLLIDDVCHYSICLMTGDENLSFSDTLDGISENGRQWLVIAAALQHMKWYYSCCLSCSAADSLLL